MGLRVDIYRRNGRNGWRDDRNVFSGVDELTLVNVSGPSEPHPDAPAAKLVKREGGRGGVTWHVEPVELPDALGPMWGGDYVGCADSRFAIAIDWYGAVALHDHFETAEQYASITRGD